MTYLFEGLCHVPFVSCSLCTQDTTQDLSSALYIPNKGTQQPSLPLKVNAAPHAPIPGNSEGLLSTSRCPMKYQMQATQWARRANTVMSRVSTTALYCEYRSRLGRSRSNRRSLTVLSRCAPKYWVRKKQKRRNVLDSSPLVPFPLLPSHSSSPPPPPKEGKED